MDQPVAPLDLEALLRTLAAFDVEFVIIGGFALSAHGVVRATKDVDIVPAPTGPNLTRLAAAIAALDGRLDLANDLDPGELGIKPDLDGLLMGGNWVLQTRHGRLDVMQEVAGIRGYTDLRQAAVERRVPDAGDFLFAGLDDLVAMKVAAGRPQDHIDITSLERARSS